MTESGRIETGAEWEALRDSGIRPDDLTGYSEDVGARAEFLDGAHMLGLIGRAKTLKPQQLQTADVLNLGYRFTSVLEPRRSSKTTSVIAWALGRCLNREDYLVAYTTMTTGKKARDRFLKDVVPILRRIYPDEKARPFKIRTAAGQERIEFDNGSIFQILAPLGDDFRSDAYDVIVLDESGEADPETADDVLSAALPTQDTRPGAMLVFAGTAAKYRKGNPLWDSLEDGRNGRNKTAVIAFHADDYLTADDLDTWEKVEPLVLAHHPGIETLTTLEAIEGVYAKLKLEQFSAEYLGIFGTAGSVAGLFAPDKVQAAAVDEDMPEPPNHFVIGIAVPPSQASASVVAAWRDETGRAKLLLLDQRPGTAWLAEYAGDKARQYGAWIAADTMGPVMAETAALKVQKPRPNLAEQNTRTIQQAAALLVKEFDNSNVDHWGQTELVDALLQVRKRKIGNNGWGFGRPDEDANIAAAEAASYALKVYDEKPKRQRFMLTAA